MLTNSLNIFNGQFLFVLKFILAVLSVFLIGGILGTVLGLDKVDKRDSNASQKKLHVN
jgi:hypothetical protein